MSDQYNKVKHDMPEADRKFYIELGWLAAASIAIATVLELAV